MNRLAKLTIIMLIPAFFLSCKTEKQKLVHAFKLYIDSLNETELAKFDSFKTETAGMNEKPTSNYEININTEEFIKRIEGTQNLNAASKQKLTAIFLSYFFPKMITTPVGASELYDATVGYTLEFEGTKRVNIEFSDIMLNYLQLIEHVSETFNDELKFGAEVHFIKITAGLAEQQALEIIDMPDYKEYYAEILDDPDVLDDSVEITQYLLNRGSAAIQFSYADSLITDKVHKGFIQVDGELVEYPIRTIFDVGKVCPPICNDISQSQINQGLKK